MPFDRRNAAVVATFSIIFVGTACINDAPPSAPQQLLSSRRSASVGNVRSAEAALVEIGGEFSGFGGLALVEDGTLMIWSKDSTQDGALADRVGQVLATHPVVNIQGSPIQIRRGSFTFFELAQWRDAISARLLGQVEGLVSVDADEGRNRVTLGIVPNSRNRDNITEQIITLGVPRSALHFMDRDAVVPEIGNILPRWRRWANTNLDDVPSPLVAGYRVTAPLGCTLGPIVKRNGEPAALTNSHCTATMYGFDGSPLKTNDAAQVGSESIDPPSYNCVYGYLLFPCRLSDAALFTLNATVNYRRGAIARTIDVSYTSGVPGSLDVDQSDNFRAIVSILAPSQVITGLMLFKTGQTTGTTGGTVQSTCSDVLGSDGYVRQCTGQAGYFSGGGDSGSPVYQPSSNQAVLAGIHWGSGGVFSYYANALSEIGGTFVSTTDITLSPSTIAGSIVSSTYPSLGWSASTVANSSQPTTYHLRRRIWNAASQSYDEFDVDVFVTTTTFSHIDYATPVNLYYGSSQPSNSINWVQYYILSANHGVTVASNSVYFRRKNVM